MKWILLIINLQGGLVLHDPSTDMKGLSKSACEDVRQVTEKAPGMFAGVRVVCIPMGIASLD